MRTAILSVVLALTLSANAGADREPKQYRAICIEGFSYSQIWRGEIRDLYEDAKDDLKDHKHANPDHTDNTVISTGDPGWE